VQQDRPIETLGDDDCDGRGDNDERLALLRRWLAADAQTARAGISTASDDASFRRYFRVSTGEESWIAMDAPPPMEDCRPFVDVADRLRRIGLNVPLIIRQDLERGFLLMTDLGDDTYLDVIGRRPDRLPALYDDAIDALATLQRRGQEYVSGLPSYDEPLLRRELGLFHDWLCERHLGLTFSAQDEREWQRVCDLLVDNALGQPQVFVHRDYHSRNLMVRADANPGIIDFQDAVLGAHSYDLVSLLKDCYVRLAPDVVEAGIDRFLDRISRDGESYDGAEFRRQLELMGVQRHLKASGIFCRLLHRDGKSRYMADVPAALGYIVDADPDRRELDWLKDFVRQRVLGAFG